MAGGAEPLLVLLLIPISLLVFLMCWCVRSQICSDYPDLLPSSKRKSKRSQKAHSVQTARASMPSLDSSPQPGNSSLESNKENDYSHPKVPSTKLSLPSPEFSPRLGPNFNGHKLGHQLTSSTESTTATTSSAQSTTPTWSMSSGSSTLAYEELEMATDNFAETNFLGQGGFGPVYKGVLSNGKNIAVKVSRGGSFQGEREFQSEIEIISRIHHKHLVSLIGYCSSGNERMLVYEYMENNSLTFHLHDKNITPTIDWATRVQIALGSAKGLAYLHEDCEPRIIHRDIKAANILLDSNFKAKVSDFGIAKCILEADTHVTTRIMGTIGYLAPEFGSSGQLTEKADIYSFGVVLLELITGRKPQNLANWARDLLLQVLEDDVGYDELVDPSLIKKYDRDEMVRMVACANACIDHFPQYRPQMIEVVRVLQGVTSPYQFRSGNQGVDTQRGSSKQRQAKTKHDTRINLEMIKDTT